MTLLMVRTKIIPTILGTLGLAWRRCRWPPNKPLRTIATPPKAASPPPFLRLGTVGTVIALLAPLTKPMDNPTPSYNLSVMDWIVGWNYPGLGTFFDVLQSEHTVPICY